MSWEVLDGDCVEVMRGMPEASIDAVVCDPPYGLSEEPDVAEVLRHWLAEDDYQHRGGGFMGRSWDSFVPGPVYWREALRVLKPGGYLLAFGGTRTYDLLVIAVRLAGFEVRDQIAWLHGQGFPKSLDVSKAIDKAAGAEREVLGEQPDRWTQKGNVLNFATDRAQDSVPVTGAPVTPEAEQWDGWGTALKPAHEPIVVARKPLAGTVVGNVLVHGTGALNIDGCRIHGAGSEAKPYTSKRLKPGATLDKTGGNWHGVEGGEDLPWEEGREYEGATKDGRWPANVVLSHAEGCVRVGERPIEANGHYPASRPPAPYVAGESNGGVSSGQDGLTERHLRGELVESWECVEGCPVAMLDAQASVHPAGHARGRQGPGEYDGSTGIGFLIGAGGKGFRYGDTGGASRFFYVAKASSAERNAGLEAFEAVVSPTMNGGIGGKPHEQVCVCDSPELGRDATKCARCGGVYDPGDAVAPKRNTHPTVKPIELMRWLVRLVTPPGGVVLDPFCGSGSTGCAARLEGVRFVGIERGDPPGDPRFANIARARIAWWEQHPEGVSLTERLRAEREREAVAAAGQDSLF